MSNKQLPIEQISKLAEDVRLIKDFAENHNFDTSLFQARVTPVGKGSTQKSWSISVLTGSFIFLVIILAVLTFSDSLSRKVTNFLFLIGMLSVTLATAAIHRKYKETTVTTVVAVGLVLVLLVGAGIFTPEEAANRLEQFSK